MIAPELTTALELPCGLVIKNRLLKSAMSEQLADHAHNPTARLERLYRTWAEGGVGLQVTGNAMVDRTAIGEPLNVILDERSDLSAFERWAGAARANGTQAFIQLNHPGKQSPRFLSKEPVAPSAIPLGGRIARGFHPPRALREDEIQRIVGKFATAARLAKRAGFTGVQIHGAHGYLVSQFLSPLHNQRTDGWGGNPSGRRRFVLEVYQAIRAEVGARYPVAIKLNSADFQRGGFGEDESMAVVDALGDAGIDLIEISGGTYEAPAMMGPTRGASSREAYFLEYSEKVRARTRARVPLAVTGGFRSSAAMRDALCSGATDMIGLGRPLALYPDLPNRLLGDAGVAVTLPRPSTGVAFVDTFTMLGITWYEAQLELLSRGKTPRPELGAWQAVALVARRFGRHAFAARRG